MPAPQQTLTEFIIAEQRRSPGATGTLTALINDIRICCTRIAHLVGKGALADGHGKAGSVNVQDEEQAKLDLMANEIFLTINERGGSLAAMVSEEMAEVYPIADDDPRGRYLLAFDPLDGSSNIDVNSPVGSIFSVQALPPGVTDGNASSFLQPGSRQVCAGLRALRRDDHDRPLAGARHARLHARQSDRRIHPHPPRSASARARERVRHHLFQRAPLGARGAAIRGRVPGWP